MKKKLLFFSIIILTGFAVFQLIKKNNPCLTCEIGDPVDSLNHVVVYYNGSMSNNSGRNTTADNYNLGIKYQCVEFIKRYYYQHLNHKMPDAFGHAKDFFDVELPDGTLNKKRNLIQYKNHSKTKPAPDDIIVFAGSSFNKYGHVAIVAAIDDDEIEIIQQNTNKPRDHIRLSYSGELWTLDNSRVLGWLRKK